MNKQGPERYNPFSRLSSPNVVVLVVAVVGVIGVLGAGWLWYGQGAGRQTVVQVTADGFIPATVTVKAGSAIVWRNVDTAPHVVASNPFPLDNSVAGLHSKTILPNGSYTYTPSKGGVISYHDDSNPTANGTIKVGE